MIVIGDRRAGVINYKLACANGSDVAEPTYDINLEMLLNNRDNASTSTKIRSSCSSSCSADDALKFGLHCVSYCPEVSIEVDVTCESRLISHKSVSNC
eukprot:scaffold2660_cov116-Skeletonema_dohrnii-CCMP3373.AAC.1